MGNAALVERTVVDLTGPLLEIGIQPATAATWSLPGLERCLIQQSRSLPPRSGMGWASSRTSVRPRRNRLGPAVGQHIDPLTAHRVDCDGALPVATSTEIAPAHHFRHPTLRQPFHAESGWQHAARPPGIAGTRTVA